MISFSVCYKTSMSVIFIVEPKCKMAASHAAPWWVTVSMSMGRRNGQTYGRTDARPLHSLWCCGWRYWRVWGSGDVIGRMMQWLV